jgi:hypothetical protein
MTKFVGLFSVVILLLLASQAEPITALLGYAWAALHFIAIIKNWYADNA